MTSIAFAPGARNDLIDIWSYTFDHWGVEQADAYTADIHAALHAAADQSPKAQSINMVRAGYWRIRTGSHICYFTRADKDIIVMRILHERMDAASIL